VRRITWTLIVAAIACVLISTPVWAQDSKNLFRFGLGWYTTIGDASDFVDNAGALWASYERRSSKKVGFEVLASYADYDPVLDLFSRDVEMTPLLFSLNYYVTSSEKVDFYVAPTIGYARLETQFAGDTDSESGFAWGAALGVDIPIGKGKWIFALSGRYLAAELGDSGFDNILFHAGAGYRF
jgi:hypothetical protein